MKTDKNTKPELLSFEEFMTAFRYNLDLNFSEVKKHFKFEEEMINKFGRELHGIIVHNSKDRVAPVFYYEDFYESYRNGATIQECIEIIVDFLRQSRLPGEEIQKKIADYALARDQLIIKLINYRDNRKYLSGVPHKRFGDMAVIAQLFLQSQFMGNGAVTVDKNLADFWDVSMEEIFDTAFSNMSRYEIKIDDLLNYAADDRMIKKYNDGPKVYVLTYKAEFNGAPAIFRMDELLQFAREKDSDFFVLPVSIGEMLLVEYKDDISYDFLNGMLSSINQDHVNKTMVLSRQVLFLERDRKELTYLKDGQRLRIYSCGE